MLHFITLLRESARQSSGKNCSWERDEKELVLTSRNVSPLVVDKLCDEIAGQSIAVMCFYFDFTAQKE